MANGGLAKLRLVMEIEGDKAVVTGMERVDAAVDRTARTTKTATERMASGMGNVETATGKMAAAADNATNRMMGSFGGIESAIKGVIAAWGSWEILKTGQDATMFAANVQQADRALSVIANTMGRTSEEAIKYRDSLRDLGITTNSSTNAVAQFMKAGLPLDGLNKLGRAAQGAAISYQMMTGEMISSSSALDKMIRALVTGNVTELHTLGINVMMRDTLRENKLATGEAATSVDTHKRHLLMFNEVLEKTEPLMLLYEKSMDLAAKQISSSKRPIEELKLALGNLFLPELTVAATAFYSTVSSGMKWVQRHNDELTTAKNVVWVLTDALKTGAEVGAAYLLFFYAIPAASTTASVAIARLQVQMALGAMEMQGSTVAARAWALVVGTDVVTASWAAAGAMGKLTIAGTVLFAAWTGFKFGEWLYDNFEMVRKFSVALSAGIQKIFFDAKYTVQQLIELGKQSASWISGNGFDDANLKQLAKERAQALADVDAGAMVAWQEAERKNKATAPKPYQNDQTAIAAGIVREAERQRKEAAAAAAIATEEAQKLAEKQAAYNKRLGDAEASLQKTYFDNAKNLEGARLAEKLKTLEYEKEMGLRSTQSFLDEKYRLEAEAYNKELAAAVAYQTEAQKALDAVNKSKVTDRIQQLQEQQKVAQAQGAVAALQQKINALQTAQPQNQAREDQATAYMKAALAIATLNNQMTALDSAEKTYSVTADEATRQRITMLEQQRAAHQTVYDSIKGAEDSAKKLRQSEQDQIVAINKSLLDQQLILRDRSAIGGAINAINKYADDATNAGKQMENAFTNAAHNIEDAFTNAFTKAQFGAKALIDGIASDVVRMEISKPLTNSVMQAFKPSVEVQDPITGKVTDSAGGALAGAAPYVAIAAVGYSVVSAIMDSDKARKKEQEENQKLLEKLNSSILSTKQGLTGEVNASQMTTLKADLKTQADTLYDALDKSVDANGEAFSKLLTGAYNATGMTYAEGGNAVGKASKDIWISSADATRVATAWKEMLDTHNLQIKQLEKEQALKKNQLLLTEMELKGQKDSTQYLKVLAEVREVEIGKLDLSEQAIKRNIYALQDQAELQGHVNDTLSLKAKEAELMGDTAEAAAILNIQRFYEIQKLSAADQVIKTHIYALEDQKKAAEDAATATSKLAASIGKTVDVALSAASAIRDIQGSDLSTDSVESKYLRAKAAFASATDAQAGELGKALLTASRPYNGTTAGYQADYDSVMARLQQVSGTPAIDKVDQQITLLIAIKDALTQTDAPLVKGIADAALTPASTITTITDAYNNITNNIVSGDFPSYYVNGVGYGGDLSSSIMPKDVSPESNARNALLMASGQAPVDMAYDINKDGIVDLKDVLAYTAQIPQLATGTNYLPGDMFIQAHQGERIIPKADNYELIRRLDKPASSDSKETVAELKEQNRLLKEVITHLQAGVRVNSAGFSKVIEQGEQSNANGKAMVQKATLAKAA